MRVIDSDEISHQVDLAPWASRPFRHVAVERSRIDVQGVELWHQRVREVARITPPRLLLRMITTLVGDILRNTVLHARNEPPRYTIDMIEMCYCLADPYDVHDLSLIHI